MERDVYALELFIAKFLRYGVIVAGLLMSIGWLSQLSFTTNTFAQFHQYHELRLTDALRGIIESKLWGLLVTYIGMFVLISLPLLRVLMTLAVFIKKRDYILAGVSALVLFGLLLSVTLGFEI